MPTSARQWVVATYRALAARGMNAGSSGNVSLRSTEGMLITPSGCSAETLKAADVVGMGLSGEVRGKRAPSSEWAMHAAIYLHYPEAQCIVHTHADACTALACLNQALPAFHYMVVRFGGEDVRCAPYVTFGTPELARLAVQALAGRSACLLANHGMIVHGRDPEQALTGAVLLETLCRQYLLARAAGTVRLLTVEEMAGAKERFRTYGSGGGKTDSSPSPSGRGMGGGVVRENPPTGPAPRDAGRHASAIPNSARPLPPSPSRKGRGRSLASST